MVWSHTTSFFYLSINESRLPQIDLQLDVGGMVRRIVGRDPEQPQRRERGAEEGEQRRSGAYRGDVRLGGGRKWNARWMCRRNPAGNDTNNYATRERWTPLLLEHHHRRVRGISRLSRVQIRAPCIFTYVNSIVSSLEKSRESWRGAILPFPFSKGDLRYRDEKNSPTSPANVTS